MHPCKLLFFNCVSISVIQNFFWVTFVFTWLYQTSLFRRNSFSGRHFVQVGEPHVNRHWSHYAASAETDGPGSSSLQCCLITTPGTRIHSPDRSLDVNHLSLSVKRNKILTTNEQSDFMKTACYHCKLALDVETKAHHFLSFEGLSLPWYRTWFWSRREIDPTWGSSRDRHSGIFNTGD